MEGVPQPIPRTVEEVFNDFRGRRSGLIKALTTDVDKFYQQCDPEKENLCLYGLPNETWEVNLPVEEFTTGTDERPAGDMHVEDYLDWEAISENYFGWKPMVAAKEGTIYESKNSEALLFNGGRS
ncbi:hypothetical protein V6N11_046820 [Hibiscus sabdariffa]|uniref:PHD finger protein ALFIN-LIKE n=1 Tax=Hibiscus sabdariffa TaxID=183260 RepID=A0ABR2A073_9ROSI